MTVLAVFLEGLLGFLSPCVLPVVPLYVAYLSGGAGQQEQGSHRMRLLINTLCFVLGISCAFLVLGLAATGVGRLFSGNRDLIARVGGLAIAIFGLLQLGVFGSQGVLSRERRLPISFQKMSMSPLVAALMGFFFSFAWTPCVGPALASVLVMAGTSSSQAAGLALVGVYALGFSLPFVVVGLLAERALSFLSAHRGVVRGTTVVGGVLLVAIGVGMMTGLTQALAQRMAALGGSAALPDGVAELEDDVVQEGPAEESAQEDVFPAEDFVLEDQYGMPHYLSDYRGKVVFLNFWTTWCTYCKAEMPEIQQLYEENGKNNGKVVVLGVANPQSGPERGTAADVPLEDVLSFLDEGGYTYPTLMDLTGNVFRDYGVASYPTTFVIDAEGNISAYYLGAMSRETMDALIAEAKTS